VLTTGIGLKPSATATVVRVCDGKTLTTDGPFAETREQLGGIFVLECADLDEAIQVASRIPDASRGGCVELRPPLGRVARAPWSFSAGGSPRLARPPRR